MLGKMCSGADLNFERGVRVGVNLEVLGSDDAP